MLINTRGCVIKLVHLFVLFLGFELQEFAINLKTAEFIQLKRIFLSIQLEVDHEGLYLDGLAHLMCPWVAISKSDQVVDGDPFCAFVPRSNA